MSIIQPLHVPYILGLDLFSISPSSAYYTMVPTGLVVVVFTCGSQFAAVVKAFRTFFPIVMASVGSFVAVQVT